MGLAWCRERVEQAQNSKSPVDRILVRCSNLIRPPSSYPQSVTNDFVYKGMRTRKLGTSYPVPIHTIPSRARHKIHRGNDWQRPKLMAVDSDKPPVPPPRKKRKPKLNSTEVLNSQLPELHSPGYVKSTEELWGKSFSGNSSVDGTQRQNEGSRVFRTDERDPGGHVRFEKLSGKRMRKIKTDSRTNDPTVDKIKNDNERKTDRKIKHVSTVSLPNYSELIKRNRKVSADTANGDDKNGNQSVGLKLPRRNSSTISLPGEGSNSILGSLSEATIHCLETYMKRCRSFGSLKPQQLLEKLEEFNKTQRSASESSDSWCGLDEWDLGVIEHCDPGTIDFPVKPKSTLAKKQTGTGNDSVPEKPGNSPPATGEKPEAAKDSKPGPTESEPDGVAEPAILKDKIEPLDHCRPPLRRESVACPANLNKPEFEKINARPPGAASTYAEDAQPQRDGESIKNAPEHSSLLRILGQYKEDESDEPEVLIDLRELVNAVVNDSQKDSMNFDEAQVEFSSKQNLSPPVLEKNRSNSLGDEISRTPGRKSRSSSLNFGSPTSLLRQLQQNKEQIEREILQRPNELLARLRRESLFRSLPKDAFEAFEKKKMTSLRDSLNEFLGFAESTGEDPHATDNRKSNSPEQGKTEREQVGKAGPGNSEDEVKGQIHSSGSPASEPVTSAEPVESSPAQTEQANGLIPKTLVTVEESKNN